MHVSSKVSPTKLLYLTWEELFDSAHKLPIFFKIVILKYKYFKENWFFFLLEEYKDIISIVLNERNLILWKHSPVYIF